MKCIFCGGPTRIVNKRDVEGYTRRRRQCKRCGERFTTKEEVAGVKAAPHAKLTRKEVIEIWQLLQERPRCPRSQIAERFGVVPRTIYDIEHRRSWKIITDGLEKMEVSST